ncbi:MAG: radical SAM protein [Acidobacteria bacterium]|nr:radical SAM protein [Acidobacteriota bacterium]
MKALHRLIRHARITRRNYHDLPSPPFLILFINSICNQKCEHCFYWRNLNRDDDLTREEIFSLSQQLGRVENLNLSGGEPFLRPEFGEICRQFIRRNKVRQIYVPTNAYFTDRIVQQITETLKEKELDLFAVEISLEGMGEFHDKFRVSPGSFDRAMASYEALARLQERDRRLRIHAISTATDINLDEIRRLSTYLFERCPKMDHHNLALIRGDRKNPELRAPDLLEYRRLYEYIAGQVLLGDLWIERSCAPSRIHSQERMLLHQRELSVAELYLPARAIDKDDCGRKSVAKTRAVTPP